MAFLQKIKQFAKSNWTFLALVVVPILRFLWKALMGKPMRGGAKASAPAGDVYKRGDVIDVQARKEGDAPHEDAK